MVNANNEILQSSDTFIGKHMVDVNGVCKINRQQKFLRYPPDDMIQSMKYGHMCKKIEVMSTMLHYQ